MWSFALLEDAKRLTVTTSILIELCKGSHNQNKNKSSVQTKWNTDKMPCFCGYIQYNIYFAIYTTFTAQDGK